MTAVCGLLDESAAEGGGCGRRPRPRSHRPMLSPVWTSWSQSPAGPWLSGECCPAPWGLSLSGTWPPWSAHGWQRDELEHRPASAHVQLCSPSWCGEHPRPQDVWFCGGSFSFGESSNVESPVCEHIEKEVPGSHEEGGLSRIPGFCGPAFLKRADSRRRGAWGAEMAENPVSLRRCDTKVQTCRPKRHTVSSRPWGEGGA